MFFVNWFAVIDIKDVCVILVVTHVLIVTQ
jgi:hypothetical protein